MKLFISTFLSLFCLILLCLLNASFAQGSLTATYTSGDIPTSVAAFDPSCNGNNIVLSVTLPAGDSYPVTGVDVRYNMTAASTGQMAHQRSQLKCVNTNTTESSVFSGSGAITGTFNYRRFDLTIANGTYAGGTRLDFEMHAWRENGSATGSCNTLTNRVDAGTWTITIYYGAQSKLPKVGVNKSFPNQSLEVGGKLKLGDDIVAPTAGTIRWNSQTADFEGYNGLLWLSLTNKGTGASAWGGQLAATENRHLTIEADTSSNFGQSVSISGTYAIVGAPNAGLSSKTGVAYILYKLGDMWLYRQKLEINSLSEFSRFGYSVSMHGNYAIVGAPGTNNKKGNAYIYIRSGAEWFLQAVLSAPTGLSNDEFGCSVCIHGDYALVGAKSKTVGANVKQGRAYIFKRNGTVWSHEDNFTASDGEANNEFGSILSLSGEYAVFGVPDKTVDGQQDRGKAYVFKRAGTIWSQQSTLDFNSSILSDRFGSSVDIDGDRIIVGAETRPATGGGAQVGMAYIYHRNGASWQMEATLSANLEDEFYYFGAGVSISGDYAVVGASGTSIGKIGYQGNAYIFKRSVSIWSNQAKIMASDGDQFDYFGTEVCIDGNEIIVGVPSKDVYNGQTKYNAAGKVYFFSQQ